MSSLVRKSLPGKLRGSPALSRVRPRASRPMMPIAIKMLFSKTILKEDAKLAEKLRVSREDIRLLKHYNMLSVT